MLATVKNEIANLPDITFEQYFMEYIMEVQDANIDKEMKFMTGRNMLKPLAMDKVIAKTWEALKSI